MGIRAYIVRYLKKWPPLYGMVAKTYYALAPYHLLELLIGTRAQENRWVKKSIAEEYWRDRENPSKLFLAEKISAYAPFSSVLEIGCASGPNLYLLAKRFPQTKFTGIDINTAAIKYGNRQFAREGMANVELLESRAGDLQRFADKSFYIVFTNAVLIYTGPDKIKQTLSGMLRISRKALVLMECYEFDESKDIAGAYYGGIWLRNYAALLKQFVSEDKIRVRRIPPEVWPGEPWKSFGAVIEVETG